MSDIATKLTYLNETKSQLKDMINYGLPTENQITNETTFRNYVKGIFEAFLESLRDSTTLYTNLPKISGNGTQITLNDTANAPMRITLKASELSQDATPTPDTPQDIHTISGDNTIVVNGKNLFDYTKHTALALNNEGMITTTKYYNVDDLVTYKLKPNTKYTFSFRNADMKFTTDSFAMAINGSWVQTNSGKYNVTTDSNGEFTCKMGASAYPNIGLASLYIQLEEGNQATTYEPYVSQTAPINLGNIEYCKIGNYEDEFILNSGKNIAYTGWASDFVNRINDSTKAKLETYDGKNCLAFYPSTGSGDYEHKYMFKPIGGFKENTQYTFKIDEYSTTSFGDMDIVYTDDSVTEVARQTLTANSWNSIVQTSSANKTIKYLKTRWRGNDFQYIDLDTFMVYVGTEDTTYEPYGTNQWYLKKNIGKVVLDGSETWNERTNAGGIKQFYAPTNLPINSVLDATQKCNYFNRYVQALWNYGGVGQFAILINTRQFVAGVEDTLSLEDFKTSLASNNLEVYYVLATPTYTKITGTLETQLNNIYKNMLSYKGTTNVSQINNDLPFVLGVSAIQDLE